MAKSRKAPAPALNMAVLTNVVQATKANSFSFTAVADHTPLIAAGLVEINPDPAARDPMGNVPTRATPAGVKMIDEPSVAQAVVGGPSSGPATPAFAAFTLDANVPVPTIKRGFVKKEPVYPFEIMQPGQSFFVPATAERPDPAKTLASTVSSATRKYEVPVTNPDGTPKMVAAMRATRDAAGDIVKDAAGKMVKASVMIPEMRRTREFVIRNVDETASGRGKGARVWRTA